MWQNGDDLGAKARLVELLRLWLLHRPMSSKPSDLSRPSHCRPKRKSNPTRVHHMGVDSSFFDVGPHSR